MQNLSSQVPFLRELSGPYPTEHVRKEDMKTGTLCRNPQRRGEKADQHPRQRPAPTIEVMHEMLEDQKYPKKNFAVK